jgi:hypothetical protein
MNQVEYIKKVKYKQPIIKIKKIKKSKVKKKIRKVKVKVIKQEEDF